MQGQHCFFFVHVERWSVTMKTVFKHDFKYDALAMIHSPDLTKGGNEIGFKFSNITVSGYKYMYFVLAPLRADQGLSQALKSC